MRLASPVVLWAVLLALTACSRKNSDDDDDTGGRDGSSAGADGSGNKNSGGGADGSDKDGSGNKNSDAGADGSGNGGSGNDGSDASDAGSAGDDYSDEVDDPACEAQSIGAEVAPPVIMLLVDSSLSMTYDEFPSTHGLTKWEATRDALSAALRAMPPAYAVGLAFFPNTSQSNPPPCFVENLVEIAPLNDQHIADLDDAMTRQRPAGYTPTQEAWKYAYAQVQDWTPTAPLYENSDHYIVVITDGVPTRGNNCQMPLGQLAIARSQYQPLIDAAADAFEHGVGTFVIGSPGSEDDDQGNQDYADPEDNYIAREMLSAFAQAGGMAPDGCSDSGTPEYCHFDMTTSTDFTPDLIDALGTITESVVSCSYTIPETSSVNVFLDPDPDTFTVEYYANGATSPENLARVADGKACTEGWQLSEDGGQIELCPDTCDRVKADPFAGIQVHFRCVVPQ